MRHGCAAIAHEESAQANILADPAMTNSRRFITYLAPDCPNPTVTRFRQRSKRSNIRNGSKGNVRKRPTQVRLALNTRHPATGPASRFRAKTRTLEAIQ